MTNLPPLTGTDKQITWATEIRDAAMAVYETTYTGMEAKHGAELVNMVREWHLNILSRVTPANTWIDAKIKDNERTEFDRQVQGRDRRDATDKARDILLSVTEAHTTPTDRARQAEILAIATAKLIDTNAGAPRP